MAKSRIYAVRNRQTGAVRLVEAANHNTALRHVAKSTYFVATVSASELRRMQAEGVDVEDVGRGEQLELQEQPKPEALPAEPPAAA